MPDQSNGKPPLAVAIVDDEPSVRSSLSRLCGVLGLQTTVYGTGRDFLDALAREEILPDCLLLDVQMPEMTGLEVFQRLTELRVRFPTVIYTAAEAPGVRTRYLAAGVAAFLPKPITGDELLAVIERVVAEARSRDAHCVAGFSTPVERRASAIL